MTTLSAQDLRLVDEAVQILAAANDLSSFPDRCLTALASAIDADLFTYNDVNLDSGEARFVLKPGRAAAKAGPAPFLRRFGYHPAATSAFPPGPGETVPRFVTDPKLRALGVGNCCGEAEIKLNAGLDLWEGYARRVGIGISRAIHDFDQRDRDVLGALHPFLIAALRTSIGEIPRKLPETALLPPGGSRLTRRENEVLYWVAMGKTNDEIATIVGAKPLTVKKHLEHVYEKLEVPNRTAAAVAARNLGLGLTELVMPPAGPVLSGR